MQASTTISIQGCTLPMDVARCALLLYLVQTEGTYVAITQLQNATVVLLVRLKLDFT